MKEEVMRDQNWLFAYGSLMWDPGFEVAERVVATLEGFHRSFCLRSYHYRGTPEVPGLVLALDEDGTSRCRGVALRVTDENWPEVIAAVRARELISDAYREAVLPLHLSDGRQVEAITYVMQPGHEQYAGGLAADEQARIIAAASGERGENRDYLYNTAAHLAELGLRDADLEHLADEVRRLTS
ncbi:gamma-glutamylcyclotransferase [Paracoccus aerodenitrificans]|uniref:gamma-glutamylcyclotransferase n=1 Tax=Paracoccus aerodenitrificans TaxID=3017781 RepID=UPI0022F01454|nr:gamma-glutamylcyclotransferase [Paracoccus aerodenitrificans]WBU62671.1 gamma-glutamylcyclotransferase [Paracoccus aerodenitrificans]